MQPPPAVLNGIEIGPEAARLTLWGALVWAAENGMQPTQLGPLDWEKLVSELSPREVCVLALHGIRGLTHEQIGEWLGGLSRGTSHILWQRALSKIRSRACELVR